MNTIKFYFKISFLLLTVISWAGDLPHTSNQSVRKKIPIQTEFVSREVKISPFTQLYLYGAIHAQVDGSLSGDKIQIIGDASTVKRVQVHMQTRKQALFLRLQPFETSTIRYLTVFVPAAMLQEVYHGSTKAVNVKNVKKPLKLFATGQGLLTIEAVHSPTVYLRGTADSQVRLSGVIGTLEVYLQDGARLDATQSYIQRSFIKTHDDAQVVIAAGARLTGIQSAGHSIVRYTYDPPMTGLLVGRWGRILRETSQ